MPEFKITVFNTITSQYEEVEVAEDVYHEFRRGNWRIAKNEDKHAAHEIPFSGLKGSINEGVENFTEFISETPDPEQQALSFDDRDLLHKAIDALASDDQALVRALYFDGLSEPIYASMVGVSQQAINKRKLRILKKIKQFLE